MSVLTNGKVNSRFDSIDPRTLYVNLINSFRNCNLTLYCVSKTRNVDKVELERVLKSSTILREYKNFHSKFFVVWETNVVWYFKALHFCSAVSMPLYHVNRKETAAKWHTQRKRIKLPSLVFWDRKISVSLKITKVSVKLDPSMFWISKSKMEATYIITYGVFKTTFTLFTSCRVYISILRKV